MYFCNPVVYYSTKNCISERFFSKILTKGQNLICVYAQSTWKDTVIYLANFRMIYITPSYNICYNI